MDYYLFICRSVTYAQRTMKALKDVGIRAQMQRAPRDLTQRGCAYAVQVAPRFFDRARERLLQQGLVPSGIFARSGEEYIEVS